MNQIEQPLVSIVVPVYNAAPRLAVCLESLRRQKYKNLEILVLNDGSDDSSMHILNMYAGVDKRILAVHKQNSGVSATRNMGISMAKGVYLQFVDADDYIDENATRLLVEKAEETRADLVLAHYCHVAGDNITVHGFIQDDDVMDKSKFARRLMDKPASFYYGVMWNKLYRTEIIQQNHVECQEDVTWSEDLLFNLDYIRYANSFAALKTPIYYYVYNESSILHSQMHPMKFVRGKKELFGYYKKLYEDLGLYEEYKVQIHKYLVSAAEHR